MALTEEQKELIKKNREKALQLQKRKRKRDQEEEQQKKENESHSNDNRTTSSSSSNNTKNVVVNVYKKSNSRTKTKPLIEKSQVPSSSSSAAASSVVVSSESKFIKPKNKNNNNENENESESNKPSNDNISIAILNQFESIRYGGEESFQQRDKITKTEAKEVYCLPEGTLAVCAYEEKIPTKYNKFNKNNNKKKNCVMKLYSKREIEQRSYQRWGGLEGLLKERQRRAQKQLLKDLEDTKDIFTS